MTRISAGALTALLLAFVSSGCSPTETRQPLPLWQVDGAHNRVYLLASVHLLRPSDYPLPDALYAAYDDAETVVMELDLDDLDPTEAAGLANELGSITGDDTLASLLGDDDYRQALALAEAASLPLASLDKTEPWLAALVLEQLLLRRIGFDTALGLEQHLVQRAARDAKEIIGLETLREQLDKLDSLPVQVQRSLFMRTLETSNDIDTIMNRLIRAWRNGDTDTLEALALRDMQRQPLLYQALVVTRNRNWVSQLEQLLQHQQDYLVVVGALHLVGEDSVIALLGSRGYRARQLEAAITP